MPQSVRIADEFLRPAQRGREILAFLHLGADYHGHHLIKFIQLPEEQQNLLVYRFRWEDDGVTDLGFLCDLSGHVHQIQVMSTNAQLNRPFFLFSSSLGILGSALEEKYKDKMNVIVRKAVELAIKNADAKTLLELLLQAEQAVN